MNSLNLYKCSSHRAFDYFKRYAESNNCKLTSFNIIRENCTSMNDWMVGGCATYFIHVEGELPETALQYGKPYKLRKGFKASKCW